MRTHKADEADGFKRVATMEEMENRREFVATYCRERFVDFAGDIGRHQMREISAR